MSTSKGLWSSLNPSGLWQRVGGARRVDMAMSMVNSNVYIYVPSQVPFAEVSQSEMADTASLGKEVTISVVLLLLFSYYYY